MTLNKFLILLTLSLIQLGCKVSSSFKPGTASNITASSILIPLAENQAAQGPTSLTIDLTERIRDYYQSNSKLTVNSNQSSDLELYITISDYFARPVSNTAEPGEQAEQMELVVNVKARFVDTKNPLNNLDNKTFSQKLLYSSSLTLEQAESDILPEIVKLITQDIFNETIARW